MELVPPNPEYSADEPHATVEHARRRWAGRMALHSPYEAGSDAYSDLGGGLPSHRADENTPKYPTGLEETILFADKQQRESVDSRHVEIIRAYDLSLDKLSSEQFHQLSLKDQLRVAVAGHDVIAKTEHRARLLRTDGNYSHPAFQHYGFLSQEEANAYAAALVILQHDLMTREVVNDIELAYRALKKSRHATLTELSRQTQDLTVSIEKDGNVVVGRKPAVK